MKKLPAIIIAVVLMIGSSSLLHNAHAQVEKGDFKAGAGFVLGSGVSGFVIDNDLGIRIDGYYSITPDIRGGGDFTYYFSDSETITETESFFGETFILNSTTKLSVWELNLNGHYLFFDENGWIIYGLAGFNITGLREYYEESSELGDDIKESTTHSQTGINIGGGLEYSLNFADFFTEAKLGGIGGNANQFVLGAGLRFSF